MAHGGSAEWNETVSAAVAPLAGDIPTVVAFGMADPVTLTSALDTLRSLGVGRVAVVRMFVSGQSFREQTEYLLGLSDDPPDAFTLPDREAGDPLPIDHGLDLATHADGLMVSPEAARILAERARLVSEEPRRESVLLLAHGMRGEEENQRVRQALDEIASEIAKTPFHSVRVVTLREDWPEERAAAESRVRSFVRQETAAGRRVIVVPMRLSGFGPYADVLQGLDYVAGQGLMPHRDVSTWIRRTASRVICANGWDDPVGGCASSGTGTVPVAGSRR
jgi:hypothetical protein